MGVTKKLISPGNGVDKPKAGDTITSCVHFHAKS